MTLSVKHRLWCRNLRLIKTHFKSSWTSATLKENTSRQREHRHGTRQHYERWRSFGKRPHSPPRAALTRDKRWCGFPHHTPDAAKLCFLSQTSPSCDKSEVWQCWCPVPRPVPPVTELTSLLENQSHLPTGGERHLQTPAPSLRDDDRCGRPAPHPDRASCSNANTWEAFKIQLLATSSLVPACVEGVRLPDDLSLWCLAESCRFNLF